LIVISSTYRQSSHDRPPAAEIDAENKFPWRFPAHRLEAEVIRDSTLAVSGLLSTKIGGPSVFPTLPAGKPHPIGEWSVSERLSDRNRRSVYIFVCRNDRYPLLKAFDFPDTHESCACRNTTTTAPQALALLNSELAAEWGLALAS
jgi:hypothetical protein